MFLKSKKEILSNLRVLFIYLFCAFLLIGTNNCSRESVRIAGEGKLDTDKDRITDDVDNCKDIHNLDQSDGDRDGMGDLCDQEEPPPGEDPDDANEGEGKGDGDGEGEGEDEGEEINPNKDSDNDGIIDSNDNCREISNSDQGDSDGDGKGDVCDQEPPQNTDQCASYNTPNVTPVDSGYFSGAKLEISKTPSGNPVAISCHNCYDASKENSALNLESTLSKIKLAINKKADLIEIDVIEENGTIYVSHEDTSEIIHAKLADLLKDCDIKKANQPLFIEIKESKDNNSLAENLLSLLVNEGYAKKDRPLYLRAFNEKRDHLVKIKTLLDQPNYSTYKDYVRIHELFGSGTVGEIQDKIDVVKTAGFHGVEFDYTLKNLFAMINYAKEKGLGVGIFTIPSKFGEVFIASMREKVDLMTVDYPIDLARNVISENNKLLLENVWKNMGLVNDLEISVSSENGPKGRNLYGKYLELRAASRHYAFFTDLDQVKYNDAYQYTGYFVSILVDFDDLALGDGSSAVILNKFDDGGFILELHRDDGNDVNELRFGVQVGGQVSYATYPISQLNLRDSYFITGAYDGEGKVRMWVNNSAERVTTSSWLVGDVKKNDMPVALGTLLEANGSKTDFFSGKVQFIQVLSWQNH